MKLETADRIIFIISDYNCFQFRKLDEHVAHLFGPLIKEFRNRVQKIKTQNLIQMFAKQIELR